MKIRKTKKELKKIYSSEETQNILRAICPEGQPKSEAKLEKIALRIVTAFVDKKENGEFLHFCSYNVHPGIIGQKVLYSRQCLKGCNYYQKYKRE